MKVAELKKALQQHGLKPEGGKAAMAAALSEVVERSALELKYGALSLPELKAVCEANAQLKGGTKPELVQRCIDGAQHGALPRCPECGGGLLKVTTPSRYTHCGYTYCGSTYYGCTALLTMAILLYSRWSTRSSMVTAGRASSLAPASMTVTPSSAALTPLPARRDSRGSRHSRCLIDA